MQDTCPICGFRAASIVPGQGFPSISCPRCGDFRLTGTAFDLPVRWRAGDQPTKPPRGRFAASHAIRRMQREGSQPPQIDSKQLGLLWSQPLPNPQRQSELMILALGDAGLAPHEFVYRRAEHFCAEIGTEDDPTLGKTGGLVLITTRLIEKDLIARHPHAPNSSLIGYRLTFEGWAEYERLRRVVVASKTAFMAMSFHNTSLDAIVAEHLIPAVRETGYELFRLDERPKPGLIDN